MTEKKYLAKIIAKDSNGLQVISACCSNGKVKIDEINELQDSISHVDKLMHDAPDRKVSKKIFF